LKKFSEEIFTRKKIKIHWDDTVANFLLDKYLKNQTLGVRALDNVFSDELRDLLANAEVFEKIRPGDTVILYYDGAKVQYKVSQIICRL